MTENQRKPVIRFAEFTDAWEQRKFGELLQTLPFKTFIKAPEQDGKYEIIQQGNEPIIGYANGIPCNDYKDTVIFGDHTLSLYKPDSSFFVATDGVRIVKGKQNIEGYFLMAMLENYKPYSEGYKRYYSILADYDCYFTKNESEQQRIGAYFKELDNLITLHQREYDKTLNIKKAMLEKMFPKNGEDRPEIRFAGFTDAWEQRELGDLAKRTYGGGTPNTMKPEYWNGDIPWIQSSNLTETSFSASICKHVSHAGIVNSATQIIPKNSIAIVTHVGVGKLSIMPMEYCASQDFISLSDLCGDSYFLAVSFQKKLQSDLAIVQGSAIKGITKNDLLSKIIFTPNINEQKKIGKLFSDLDNLITLHQREP